VQASTGSLRAGFRFAPGVAYDPDPEEKKLLAGSLVYLARNLHAA
jgi:hypothetical protein